MSKELSLSWQLALYNINKSNTRRKINQRAHNHRLNRKTFIAGHGILVHVKTYVLLLADYGYGCQSQQRPTTQEIL